MANYIYPESIEHYCKKHIRRVPKGLKPNILKKLVRHLKSTTEYANELTELPDHSEGWVVDAFKKGESLFLFEPNEALEKKIVRVSSFLKEAKQIVTSGIKTPITVKAKKAIRTIEHADFIQLSKQSKAWFSILDRPSSLELATPVMSTIPLQEGYWYPASQVDEIKRWGKNLGGNCLADGFYDDEITEKTIKIWGCFSDDNKILAVAAFQNEELTDFEGFGLDSEARQKNSKQYRDELLILLNEEEYTVPHKRFSFLNIFGQIDLTEIQHESDGMYLWFNRYSEQIIVKSEDLDDFFVIDLDRSTGSYELISLNLVFYSDIKDRKVREKFIDRLCHALCIPIDTEGNLLINDLSIFQEFSYLGNYWKYTSGTSFKLEEQTFVELDGELWNQPLKNSGVDKLRSFTASDEYNQLQRRQFLESIFKYELEPKTFLYHLCNKLTAFPDLAHDVNGNCRLIASVANNKAIKSEEGWDLFKKSECGNFEIHKREVDDYFKTKSTAQYICTRKGKLKAGFLIRQWSPRKYTIYIQAPGNNPEAFNFLWHSTPDNMYTDYVSDYDIRFSGKLIEDWFYKNQNIVKPKEVVTGTNYNARVYKNETVLFDEKNNLLSIFEHEYDEVDQVHIVTVDEQLKTQFSKICSILGLKLSPSITEINRLGLQLVKPSNLDLFKYPEIEIIDHRDRVNIKPTLAADVIDFFIEISDECIYVQVDGLLQPSNTDLSSLGAVMVAVLNIQEKRGIYIDEDDDILQFLSICYDDKNGFYLNGKKIPKGWGYSEEGFQMIDDESPCMRIKNGNVQILTHDFDVFAHRLDDVSKFIAWYHS